MSDDDQEQRLQKILQGAFSDPHEGYPDTDWRVSVLEAQKASTALASPA